MPSVELEATVFAYTTDAVNPHAADVIILTED